MASQIPIPPGAPSERKKRGMLPPEIMELIVPPLKVGAYSGTAGVFAGVAASIARETSPVASGLVSGFQWFTIGSTFWFSRTVTLRAWGNEDQLTSSERVKISGIAGSTTGALTGLFRGPSKILPSIILWGLLGAGGQLVVNRVAVAKSRPQKEGDNWLTTLSPLKKLTDQEYLDMMGEKILRVEADIALIDDRITELRKQEQHQANGQPSASEPKSKA